MVNDAHDSPSSHTALVADDIPSNDSLPQQPRPERVRARTEAPEMVCRLPLFSGSYSYPAIFQPPRPSSRVRTQSEPVQLIIVTTSNANPAGAAPPSTVLPTTIIIPSNHAPVRPDRVRVRTETPVTVRRFPLFSALHSHRALFSAISRLAPRPCPIRFGPDGARSSVPKARWRRRPACSSTFPTSNSLQQGDSSPNSRLAQRTGRARYQHPPLARLQDHAVRDGCARRHNLPNSGANSNGGDQYHIFDTRLDPTRASLRPAPTSSAPNIEYRVPRTIEPTSSPYAALSAARRLDVSAAPYTEHLPAGPAAPC